MDKSQTPPGRDGGHQFPPGPKVSKKDIEAVKKNPAKHLSDLFAKHYAKKKMKEEVVAEAGPFSYGSKPPRKGSVADLAAKKRKEQQKGKQPVEPKDQMVGVAKVITKGVAEEVEQIEEKSDEAYNHYKKQVLPIYKKHGLSPEFAKAVNNHVAKHGSYQVWNHHGDAEGQNPHWFDSEKQKVKSIKQKRGYEVSEEVELDEVLKPSMGAGEYIKDFQKSDAPQFKGKTKEKRRMMGIAAYLQAKRKMSEETELDESYAKVETKKYSWGTMKTAKHGASFSVPMHPEHHKAIYALKDNQEHKFKDETGHHWTAKRMGDDVHLHSANDGPKTKIKHSDLKEEVEQIDELNSSDIVKIHNDAAAHHTASLANKPEQKPKSMMDKIKDKWSKADPKKYQKYYAKEEVEIDEESCSTDTGWKKVAPGNVKDKSGAVHTPMSRAKHLARMAMQKKMKEEFDIEIDDALADSLVETVLDENIWIEEALIGGQKKLDKNHNGKLDADDFKKLRKEHVDFDDEGNLVVEKVSYADFMANLQEIKMADLPVRKVTGRAYGGGHQKDTPEHDEDEDTPKATPVPTEKRGRGRPKGSKSGANLKVTSGKRSSGVDYTGYPLHLPNRNR